MGNTRRFRAGRQQRNLSLKQQIRALQAENGYLQGTVIGLSAKLSASKMERPPDLDEWVESVLDDMDAEERATWESMSPDEQESFKDELGQRIHAAQALLSVGGVDADGGAVDGEGRGDEGREVSSDGG